MWESHASYLVALTAQWAWHGNPPSCQFLRILSLAFFPQKRLLKCPSAGASRRGCLPSRHSGRKDSLPAGQYAGFDGLPSFQPGPHPQPLLCLPLSADRPLVPFFLNIKVISLGSRGYLGRDLPLSGPSSQGQGMSSHFIPGGGAARGGITCTVGCE